MGLIEAIIIGVVQGLTEFLPISSSAHIVLVPALFGLPGPDIYMVVALHAGSLVAVITYFFRDLVDTVVQFVRGVLKRDLSAPGAKLGTLLIIATIPAALAGFFGEAYFEKIFAEPRFSGYFLLATAAILLFGELFSFKHREISSMTRKDAILVGLAQAFAILPGISRSGSTISMLMLRGLKRDEAAHFSFLMSVVIVAGAATVALRDVGNGAELASEPLAYLAGFFASAIASYFAVAFLMRYLKANSLYPFSVYCLFAGIFTIAAL